MSVDINKKKVLVLGNGTRAFLSVIRSLGRHKIEIHAFGLETDDPAFQSKYISKRMILPPFSPNIWNKILTKYIKEEKIDLIIPCSDNFIIALREWEKELSKITKIYLLNDKTYSIVNNKQNTGNLARNLNIKCPNETQFDIDNSFNIDAIIEKHGLPLVIKPYSSFTINDLNKKNQVHIISKKSDLHKYVKRMKTGIIQDYFKGIGVGVEVLANNGKIHTIFQHRRVHEPLKGGGSSYRVSEKIDLNLYRATKKLVSAMNYTGVAMFEFKKNYYTKDWVLLEINGRFWGSLPLAIVAGIDFPFYLYELLMNGKTKFNTKYKTGIYCRNLTLDFNWIISNIKADKKDPTLNTLSNFKVLKEFKNLILNKERFDSLKIIDLKPGIAEICSILKSIITSILFSVKIKLLNISFVRNRKKKKIYKKFINSKKIMFICKGNICRSPLAEIVSISLFPNNKSFISRGYYRKMGRKPPIEAIKAANINGFDLSSHISKPLKQKDINSSDLIFVFDIENYSLIKKNFLNTKKKVFFLGILGKNNIIITDPFNKKQSDFINTYRKIINSLYFLKDNYDKKK